MSREYFISDEQTREDAMIGSARLRDAIYVMCGLAPLQPNIGPANAKLPPALTEHQIRFLGGHSKIAPVIKAVCARFGVSREQLLSSSRKAALVRPRQIAMYLAIERGASWNLAAREFGRDHTTVIHAHRTVIAKMDELRNDLASISSRLLSDPVLEMCDKESGTFPPKSDESVSDSRSTTSEPISAAA